MILETAILNVRKGEESAFEAVMKTARPLIAATPGFKGIELRRCIEIPNRYLLLVKWQNLEGCTSSEWDVRGWVDFLLVLTAYIVVR